MADGDKIFSKTLTSSGAFDKLITCREASLLPDVGCTVRGYHLVRILGEGGFARVYKAKRESDCATFAIKVVLLPQGEITKSISREIDLMYEIDDIHIVRLFTIFVVDDRMFLVMEYVAKDLNRVISDEVLSIGVIKKILCDIIAGVQYLHNRNIVHRDLKPANVLISEHWNAKLVDFGLSRAYMFQGAQVTPLMATPDYSAPELLMMSSDYTIAVDMWSIGCIFAEMLEKTPPFATMEIADLFGGNSGMNRREYILRSIFRKLGTPSWPGVTCLPGYPEDLEEVYPQQELEITAPLDEEGRDLLKRLLCLNPGQRITAAEALQHPFLRDVPVSC